MCDIMCDNYSPSSSFCFSIDVLSDGSEYTGDAAALFLSLWKKTDISEDLCDNAASLLISRYAVAGCSCDVLSRAAADQRYKLGGVKAVFGVNSCGTTTNSTTRNSSSSSSSSSSLTELAALPGLLYASQHQADLTVVVESVAAADRLERLVQTVHGNQTHPIVRICAVPPKEVAAVLPSANTVMQQQQQQQHETWWKVYDDDHVVVHARRCCITSSSSCNNLVDDENTNHDSESSSSSADDGGVEEQPSADDDCDNNPHTTTTTTTHTNASRSSVVRHDGSSDNDDDRGQQQPQQHSGSAAADDDASIVVYLYTFRALLRPAAAARAAAPNKNSLLIVSEAAPAHAVRSILWMQQQQLLELPLIPTITTSSTVAVGNNGIGGALVVVDVPATLLTTIVVVPPEARVAMTQQLLPNNMDNDDDDDNNNKSVFLVRRRHQIDPGLLVRAQQQTRSWRQHCSSSSNNDNSSPSMLKYFPFRTAFIATTADEEDTNTAAAEASAALVPLRHSGGGGGRHRTFLLRSGTSLFFGIRGGAGSVDRENESTTALNNLTYIDRNEQRERSKAMALAADADNELSRIGRGNVAGTSTSENACPSDAVKQQQQHVGAELPSVSIQRDQWPEQLKDFLTFHTHKKVPDEVLPCHDENEIDLDDDDETDSAAPGETSDRTAAHTTSDNNLAEQRVPHLLVLGTGCASPSPHRGASGYALILPSTSSRDNATASSTSNNTDTRDYQGQSSLVVAVEVGEGYCTQWNRYADNRPFSSIHLIWISHAHWDHYGGLVNLLIQIDRDKRLREQRNQLYEQKFDPDTGRPNKRYRSTSPSGNEPPWVVAPAKVLMFLKLVFDQPQRYYREVLPESAMMEKVFMRLNSNICNPILFWENIRVDHSCQAYGFVLGLRSGDDSPFIFCFSGDTRPCWRLVQACRALSTRYGARVDFLLHEATFDESEKHMSHAKKHSTVQEALKVARDVDARRLMLTHFSQRYDSVPAIAAESNQFNSRMAVGFALDGLMIPLFAT